MKKITFLLVAFMATMFCACSNDDNDTSSNFLEGTTWVSNEEEQIFTLEFQKTTAKFTYQYDDNGDGIFGADETKEESVVNYTLDGNNIVIKEGNKTSTGAISGNKMVLSADGDSVTYFKK